jgi:hypothetical protein
VGAAALVTRALGDACTCLDLPSAVDRDAARVALQAWPGVRDVVIADGTAAVWHDGPIDWRGFAWPTGTRSEGVVHRLPVVFDGPDLPGALWLEAFLACTFHIQFFGFLPGFAYLGPVPAALRLPRRPSPRPRVDAGAVALGGPYAGVYPLPSPGGWSWVGRTTPPVPGSWALGDRVRFVR